MEISVINIPLNLDMYDVLGNYILYKDLEYSRPMIFNYKTNERYNIGIRSCFKALFLINGDIICSKGTEISIYGEDLKKVVQTKSNLVYLFPSSSFRWKYIKEGWKPKILNVSKKVKREDLINYE